MAAVVIRPRAEGDLRSIWRFIAADNPVAATGVYQTLRRRIDSLSDIPRLGPRRDEIKPGYRGLIDGAYLILYRLTPDHEGPVDTVEIVRVIDGRRHLSRLV